jgi:hypothetical protein
MVYPSSLQSFTAIAKDDREAIGEASNPPTSKILDETKVCEGGLWKTVIFEVYRSFNQISCSTLTGLVIVLPLTDSVTI